MRHPLFAHLDEIPVQPPFLVRDTDPVAVVERHRRRMAAHPTHPVEIEMPTRSPVALKGKASLGLAFDQQESLVDALTGVYAKKYWPDMWQPLYKRWGLSDVLDTILGDGAASPPRIRKVLAPILLDTNPDIDEEARALLFLFRAWQFRYQVMVEQRAVDLTPVVGGDEMGHTISFTPVFKRLSHNQWRLGWPGDTRRESPHLIETRDVAEAMQTALPLFNRWYFEDQAAVSAETAGQAKHIPDHIYLLPWGQRLRQQRELTLGQPPAEAYLEEVSHNHLFRLRLPDGRQFVLRGDPLAVVQQGLAANGRPPLLPTPPTVAEMNEAYLAAMKKRGEEAQLRQADETADAKPFTGLAPSAAYVVSIEGPNVRREITVTWVSGHPAAMAVVCGSSHPARAVVMVSDNRAKLGLAPVSFTTRKPDLAAIWTTTLIAGLNVVDDDSRRVISAWAAWVWQDKAGSYPPPRRE